MSDSKQYLNDFYQCIETESDDNLKVEKSLKLTIYSLDARDALRVALNQIESYLPILESTHSEISWVREWFNFAKEFNPWEIDISQYDEIEDEELNSFYRAIVNLHYAFNSYVSEDGDAGCKYSVLQSVAGIRSQKLSHHWSINDPTSWSIYQQIRILEPTDVDEALYRTVKNYMQSQRRKEYSMKLWRDIADDIKSIANL